RVVALPPCAKPVPYAARLSSLPPALPTTATLPADYHVPALTAPTTLLVLGPQALAQLALPATGSREHEPAWCSPSPDFQRELPTHIRGSSPACRSAALAPPRLPALFASTSSGQ